MWVRSNGDDGDLMTPEPLRVGDVLIGASPEVVRSIDGRVVRTGPPVRPLVELELRTTRTDKHDIIGLMLIRFRQVR